MSTSADGDLRRVDLPGSRILHIRPLSASDAPGLVALFATLDEEDLYRRFFAAHAPPERFIEKMARVEERGGIGLAAVLETADGSRRVVGEASSNPLPDGNGELGITVAPGARGWLGAYLLDALVEEAARRGVPNIEADVLVTNRRMLSLLHSRGYAVMDHSEQPVIVRVTISTRERVAGWSASHDRPRVLVEVPGGRWRRSGAARAAGFEVLLCPGPLRGWAACPAVGGQPCPLAAHADVIVDAVPGEPGTALLAAHRRLHPTVPVCVDLPTEEPDQASGAPRLPGGSDERVVVEFLQRLSASGDEGADAASD